MRMAVGVTPAVDNKLALEVLAANRAALAERLPIVLLAVDLATLLVEAAAQEGLAAGRANKVLRMPGLAQRRRRRTRDRLAAASAARAKALVKTGGVIRPAVLCVELLLADDTTAASAAETGCMPGMVQGSDVVASDGFATAVAGGHGRSLTGDQCTYILCAHNVNFQPLV